MFIQAEAVRLEVRVCGDEHQQASPQVIWGCIFVFVSTSASFTTGLLQHHQSPPSFPLSQDWRAGGRDHQGEVEDQRRLRAARRHFQRDAPQILDKDLWPVLWRHWIYVVTVDIFVETKYTKYSCSPDLSNHHHGETGVWTRYIVPASVFHLENNEPLFCKCLRSRTYFAPFLSGFLGVSLLALDF